MVFFLAGPDGHGYHVAEVAAILVHGHAVGLLGIHRVDDVVCILSSAHAPDRKRYRFRVGEGAAGILGGRIVAVVVRVECCGGA
jgi:hypothetical protein